MFKLTFDELNRRHVTKPIQSTEEMFEALGFDDLMEPGVMMELSTAFHNVFERYARITNLEDGGEKVFAYDAYRLVELVSRMWVKLYSTVATSREEVLRDKALLKEEVYGSYLRLKKNMSRSWRENWKLPGENCKVCNSRTWNGELKLRNWKRSSRPSP